MNLLLFFAGLAALVLGANSLVRGASKLALSLACLPVFMTGREIARWEGGVFVAYYMAYVAYLILAAQQHDALKAYSAVMMSFVVPITVITLVVVVLRRPTVA